MAAIAEHQTAKSPALGNRRFVRKGRTPLPDPDPWYPSADAADRHYQRLLLIEAGKLSPEELTRAARLIRTAGPV